MTTIPLKRVKLQFNEEEREEIQQHLRELVQITVRCVSRCIPTLTPLEISAFQAAFLVQGYKVVASLAMAYTRANEHLLDHLIEEFQKQGMVAT